MNRGAMYNCPACGENFNSKTLGIKHCPFCGAKYKDMYTIHMSVGKSEKGNWYANGNIPAKLVNRIYERYRVLDYEVEVMLDPHKVILYLNPILEKVITPITNEPDVAVVTHPEISVQLSKSRMDNINAMQENLEKELQNTKSLFERVELRAKISLLETLKKENDY